MLSRGTFRKSENMARRSKILKFTVREFGEDNNITTYKVPLVLEQNEQTSATTSATTSAQQPEPLPVPMHVHVPEELQEGAAPTCSPWVGLRQSLIHVFFEEAISKCAACSGKISQQFHIRCRDCGNQTYYCSEKCCSGLHRSEMNPFHKPMKWDVLKNRYSNFYLNMQFVRPSHSCGTQQCRDGIQVYDPLGRPHTVSVVTCGCEDVVTTMFRHGLWASTLDQPKVAFHIELLNTVEFAMLEGKMSLHAFCQTMRWRNDLTFEQSQRLYTSLRGEPIGQYRHFKYLTRTLSFLNTDEEVNSEQHWKCIACPMESGDVFVSLDANFGLVRKKGKDATQYQPNHKDHGMFINLPDEDQPESETGTAQQCSNFQAVSVLRSKTRNSKLDITGVFGAACRHGIPISFMDLKHGERLSLSETMIDHLLNRLAGQETNLHILYDIGCLLHAHLKAKGDSRFDDISFAVPSFHAYGHKASCQVQYSTRWQSGYGLTDGEVMERLWSFLRRFSFITKEMTATNRIDLLTDALIHYRRKKNEEMEYMLVHNLEKANKVLAMTTEELRQRMDTLSISGEEVDELVKIHQESLTNSSNKGSSHTQEEKYVQLLLKYSELEKKHGSTIDMDKQEEYNEQLSRLDKEICSIERKNGIHRRWSKSGKKFKESHLSCQTKRKLNLLHKMHDNAVEYEFIVNLKNKYAGERNQKIVQRLQKQIQRSSKAAKRIAKQYNQAGFTGNCGGIQDTVRNEELLKPDAPVYHHVYGTQQNTMIRNISVSSATRHNIAELRNRQLRATEEQKMTREEMLVLLRNLGCRYEQLVAKLSTTLCKGIQVELINRLEEAANKYYRARAVFERCLPILPDVPDFLMSNRTSCLIDEIVDQYMSEYPYSDCDSESDYDEDTAEDYDSAFAI